MDHLIRQRYRLGPSAALAASQQHPKRARTPPATDYDDGYNKPNSNDDHTIPYDSNDILSVTSSSLVLPPFPSSRPSRLASQTRPIAKSAAGGAIWRPLNAQRAILPIGKQLPTPTVSAGRQAPTASDADSSNEIDSIDANSDDDIFDNSSEKPNLTMRLTILDEPLSMGDDLVRGGQRSSDNSMSDSSSNSRSRQTFLPTTSAGVSRPHWPPAPTLLFQEQQQSDYLLPPSLLLLSLVIIIFGAYLRFRSRNKRFCWPKRWLSNLALRAGGKSASTRRNNSKRAADDKSCGGDESLEEDCEAAVDEGEFACATTTSQKLLGCAATSGCSIELVERKPAPDLPTAGLSRSSSRAGKVTANSNGDRDGGHNRRDDCDATRSVGAADDSNLQKGSASSSLGREIRLETHHASPREGLSTMVILKRRFAKSPFLVAGVARSTGPRVKLLTARVRKFIDDEAEELRAKKLMRPASGQSLRSRVMSFALAPLSSQGRSREKDQEANDDEQDETKMLPSTQLLPEQQQQQEAGNSNHCRRLRHREGDRSSASIEAEIHREQLASEQQQAAKMIEVTLMGGNLAGQQHLSEQRQPPGAMMPSASQLSPSPVIADGCSSLSGCTSLLTPSPSLEHQPSCGCILSRERLAIAAADLAAFGLAARSKSQQEPAASSPCRLIEPNPAAYRPCCSSASPSALNHHQQSCAQSPAIVACGSGRAIVVIDNARSPLPLTDSSSGSGKFYPAQHQPPPANHYQPLGSVGDFATNTTDVNSKMDHQQQQPTPASSLYGLLSLIPAAPNAASIAMGKYSSHIKRQYENYYDDERQDAYQRLTASIGIELGLNFDDDPHHHHHHHHHHEATHAVVHAHTLSYAAGSVADLSHFPPFDCHHSAAANVEKGANYLSSSGGEFQQPMLPLKTQTAASHQPQENMQPACKCCQRSPTQIGAQQQSMAPSDFLFKSGQAGNDTGCSSFNKLGSSPLCRSPLCTCQAASIALSPPPPMSILVRQPSMATPPPPPTQAQVRSQHQASAASQSTLENNHYQQQPHYQSSSANISPTIKHSPSPADERRSASETATTAGEPGNSSAGFGANRGNVSPGTLAGAACVKPKWRQHRHLSQRQQESADLAVADYFLPSSSSTTTAWPASSSSRQPRRTSIAGDQVSQVGQDVLTLSGQQHQHCSHHHHHHHHQHQASHIGIAARSACVERGSTAGPSSPDRQLLQHRASIASDGTWNQASIYNQLRLGNGCLSQFEQKQAHQHHLALQSSQRPSEASLYDPQYCSGALHGKSNYSSSGGSSSGIGISGSICTNASAGSVLQQYGSFATTNTDGMLIGDCGHLQADPSAAGALCSYQNHGNYYLHGAHALPSDLLIAAGCQIASCPSRKFSLPVQLESQTSDRLSPATSPAKLLFGKHLHRVDSSSLAAAAGTTAAADAQHYRPRGLPGEAVAIRNNCSIGQLDSPSILGTTRQDSQQQQRYGSGSSRTTNESRRSSQTITRQSSFWLEDNSVGSILSLTTSGAICMQSEDGSQLDVNQMPQDERTFSSQPQQRNQQQQPGSQRPPMSSSIVLSGDSIESVKQRPLVAQAPVEEACLQACDSLANRELADENDVFETDTSMNTDENDSNNQQQHAADSSSTTTHNNSNSSASSSSSDNNQSEGAQAADNSPSPTLTQPQPQTSTISKESSSSALAMQDKRFNSFRTLAYTRNRLSSSSTSSTTSSPSPDFGDRPSERILGLAAKSGMISKRRLFGKLRSRRYPRLGASSSTALEQSNSNNPKIAAHRHSAPNSSSSFRWRGKQPSEESAKSEGYTRYSTETDQCSATSLPANKQNRDSDPGVDVDFLSTPSERPISGLNSASLERQCRELWKLRATLHDDTCVGDNWSNYHQRLNRRYDSGYKSIENQLSSSLEGNVLPANIVGVQAPPGKSPTHGGACAQQLQATGSNPTIDASLLVRPQSGCSGYICGPSPVAAGMATSGASLGPGFELANQQTQQNIAEFDSEFSKFTAMIVETDEEFSYHQEQEGSIGDTIDGKLADLNLDDGALECLLGNPVDRECQSRSSKSSNEDDSKSKGLDGDNLQDN